MKIDKFSKIVSLVGGILTIFWVSYNIIKEYKLKTEANAKLAKDNAA